MANDNPTPPPISGRWKPGQSGNPSGRPKRKPVSEGLIRLFAKLDDMELEEYNREIVKKAASGDVAAYREVRETIEGKLTTQIVSENVTRILSSWNE